MSIIGTGINTSATVILPAGEDLTEANGKAVIVDNGTIKLAGAGANAFGILLISQDEEIKAKQEVSVQIKDIGMWISGEALSPGDEVTSDNQGRAVKATPGDFITGIVIGQASQAGVRSNIQIVKAGYKA